MTFVWVCNCATILQLPIKIVLLLGSPNRSWSTGAFLQPCFAPFWKFFEQFFANTRNVKICNKNSIFHLIDYVKRHLHLVRKGLISIYIVGV